MAYQKPTPVPTQQQTDMIHDARSSQNLTQDEHNDIGYDALNKGRLKSAAAGGPLQTHESQSSDFRDSTRDLVGQEHGYVDDVKKRLDAADGRAAPTMQAAQLGPAREFAGALIAQNERSAGAQLGPAAQGTATMGSAAGINRSEDQQFRAGQVGLANALAAQAAGQNPSLATGALKAATDRNIKQQMAVSAAQGGNPAMAQRNAALGAAQMNQQAGRDSAQMRMQEQMSAQQQLAGVLAGGRGQDLGVANAQAGFNQQSGLANQQYSNQFGLANMDARNQFAMQQAQMSQQNQQFNATQTNAFNNNQAGFMQQAGLNNMAAANQFTMQNAMNQQAANASNLTAAQQQTALNDARSSDMLSKQEADLARARQGMQQENVILNNALAGQATNATAQSLAAKQQTTQLVGAGIGAGAAIAGGVISAVSSDTRSKDDLEDLSPKARFASALQKRSA